MNKFIFQNKNEFILFDFLFWFLLAVIFPSITGNFSLSNIVRVFIYFSAVYYLGELLLSKIDAIKQIPFLFKAGIYIVFGGIVTAIIYLFFPSAIILYVLAFIFFIELILTKRWVFAFSFNNFLCLVPFFLVLFQTFELVYGTAERYSHQDGDYFYYSAIVESIKANHSLNNAVYHRGLPINYLVAPFLAPAQLSDFTGISSQFALWGVYGKIIPVVCLATISYSIVKLYEIIFKASINKGSVERMQIFVACMLLFLGPLHFLNLAKLDFANTLFLGEGYVLPVGSPGFALSMFFAAAVLLLVFSKKKYTLPEQVVLIIFLSIIIASKIALFLPLGALLGTLSILWLLKKQGSLFFTLIIALPFCIIIYKLTLASTDSIVAVEFTNNGYYFAFFKDLIGKYGFGSPSGYKVFMMVLIGVFMWLSIKLLIFVVAGFSLLKNNYGTLLLMVAGIITFVISLLPGFFINIYGRDTHGKFLFDGNYDTTQFVRGGIFLLTIIALIYSLSLVYGHRYYIVKKTSLITICVWMITISYSFFSNGFEKAEQVDQTWYKEVQQDFARKKPGLMAMLGNGNHSGQTLTTAGVHPWFCTGLKEDQEGFVLSKAAYERNFIFRDIFNSEMDIQKRQLLSDSIRRLGVDCIVASPTSMTKIGLAIKDSIISIIPGTKWFYRLNSDGKRTP